MLCSTGNVRECDDCPHEFEALQIVVAAKRDRKRTRALDLRQKHRLLRLEAVEELHLDREGRVQVVGCDFILFYKRFFRRLPEMPASVFSLEKPRHLAPHCFLDRRCDKLGSENVPGLSTSDSPNKLRFL